MKFGRNFLEKSLYLRKFCLIYLIKLNQKNKNCQFCLDKIFEKNYKVRDLPNINYIKEDFFKFSSFFQNAIFIPAHLCWHDFCFTSSSFSMDVGFPAVLPCNSQWIFATNRF